MTANNQMYSAGKGTAEQLARRFVLDKLPST